MKRAKKVSRSEARKLNKGFVIVANDPVQAPPQKTESNIPPQRIVLYLRSRFNPIRSLTPELLSTYLDRFKVGFIREAALVWDSIEDRDDKIKTVKPLREKAVSRLKWEIKVSKDLDPGLQAQADAHKAALTYFYQNLTTTSAIDTCKRGKIPLLVRQMATAVGSQYAVHEIVWIPKDGQLTAEFRFTPLWFFEATQGRLRYLPTEGLTYGDELDAGGWMITTGDGLMFASSIAYMYKSLSLKDWVTYCERSGQPAFIGKTNSQINTPQWNAMQTAVQSLSNDFAAVMNTSESIEALDLKGAGAAAPYEPLVERMDRSISALWRGGDLSTMSSGKGAEGHGASRQGDEADNILEDDAETISETLQYYVDRYVIQYVFGDDTPLAHFHLVVPPNQDIAQDIAVDTFLVTFGAPVSVQDAMNRYGRSMPGDPGDPILVAPAPKAGPGGPGGASAPPPSGGLPLPTTNTFGQWFKSLFIANAKPVKDSSQTLLNNAKKLLAASQAEALKPVRELLENAMNGTDAELDSRMQAATKQLPGILKKMNLNPATAAQFEATFCAALMNGLTEKSQ